MSAVIFDKVNIVFGERPETALPLMDQGLSRAEIQLKTNQILGVHDCSLTVAEGEILVLMGLSGSGKSTLLRAVNGLNPVVRGEVRIQADGHMASVTKADPATLRGIRQRTVAMVFQQFGLLPWRTVRDNVGLGLELRGQSKAERAARVEEELRLVNLADRAEALVGQLSGGMQQRVGLARAFATDAPVLLMDEPFSALDPLIRTRLQDELLDLQRVRNRTIIFVSHDLDEAFKIGNRIAIMEGGRIVQCGTPREIFRDPATPYVAEFVQHMNPLGVLRARDVMTAPNGVPPHGEIAPDADIRDVMTRLRGGPLAVREDGATLGHITPDGVLARLLDPRA
ncbi:choline ABC transporter ATP-binding protein [Rubellimicrobium aerolatum]|uniref:Choline ABC transporter ATP-binding protein n=1 Tax=Rubellimicrobium aerolatum TaxID=490979 RepID=A0ABW0SC54_9RHOB|nr:choline ABC transporter ATP-binding protein [Rubellimicrobium aerolatum]MBP1806254.1 glycine betaine/proline transport system ATP-binding protein [Rubellimicrobium aerolatum]